MEILGLPSGPDNGSNLPGPKVLDVKPAYGSSEEPAVLEYWDAIYRRKWPLILSAFLGAVIGYASVLPQLPVYQAITSLEVGELNDSFLNIKDADLSSGGRGSVDSMIRTEMKLLESRSLRRHVIENLHADNDTAWGNSQDRLSIWLESVGLPGVQQTPTRSDAIRMAARTISIRNPQQTMVLEVVSDSFDPQIAADFVNQLVQTYVEQSVQGRLDSVAQTREWLDKQLAEVRLKLQDSENQFLQYAADSGLLLSGEDQDKLRQLRSELWQAEIELLDRGSMYELATSGQSMPLPKDDPILYSYETKLHQKQAELADLSSILAPGHYKIRRLKSQIDALSRRLEQNTLTRVREDYEAAKLRHQWNADEYSKHAGVVAEQSEKMIYYNMLKREVDTNRQLYDSLLQKVKEAGIAAALRASTIRIVDVAEAADEPHRPRPLIATMIGFCSGSLIGIVFVFLRHSTDRKLRAPGEISAYSSIPELGAIPSRKMTFRPASPKLLDAAENGKLPKKLELATWLQSFSVQAESFRSVLVSILSSDESRLVVVTSPNSREGKTTVISNLALALAEIDRRVLLIDADLRRPRLHEIFDIPNTRGVSDLCKESRPVSQYDREMLGKPTRIPGLHVLPSGSPTISIAKLLHSKRLSEILERAKEEFDQVLIDSPPTLDLSDARVLGLRADGVILVLRARHTTREAGIAAIRRFQEDGTRVLGTVLNDWDSKQAPSYYSPTNLTR